MNQTLTLVVLALYAMVSWSTVHAKDDGDKKILYWVAPMDPSYRRDGPGKSPMGMDLVPVYADEAGGDEADVTISPAVVQNLGVRTAPVERGDLSRIIDTVGYIDFDESKVSHVHPRVSGWLEKLTVRFEGEAVKKGQRLFNLYSPELVNAQKEFLRALSSGNQGLISASRERLAALGISRGEITALERRRKVRQTVAIYAPQSGVVSELPVREGMYVKPAMKVMTLADLSSVWLIAEVFEREAGAVAIGDPAQATLPYLPGKRLQGRVDYIYPRLDPKTRALKVRMQFKNPDESLKPNMYARVRIAAKPRENVLSIPLEALIRTGDQDRVIIALGEGKFKACPVVAGIESGDRVEIRDGLSENDRVVVSGQFLLDSEASLKASFTRMSDDDHSAMDSMEEAAGDGSMPAKAEAVQGTGKIVAVDADNHQIKMQHDPIPALGWPGMTMMFDVTGDTSLDGFGPGDEVRFELGKREDGYPITALHHRSGD